MTNFLGAQRIDFTVEATGDQIKGYNLWFSEPAPEGSIGLRLFKHFMSDAYVHDFFGENGVAGLAQYVNCPCVITYNRFGKIANLSFE